MTGGQFREVDLDLLADYVGGALDGTPDEVEIARLVEQDPAWAAAYTELTAGLDAVRLDLAGWAAEPTPMPPQVVDRLTAVLAGAALSGGAALASPTAPASPTDLTSQTDPDDAPGKSLDTPAPEAGSGAVPGAVPGSGPGSSGGSVPGGPTHPAGRPGRQSGVPGQPGAGGGPQRPGRPSRRRRWSRRVAAPVLVATVVAGFAGFALNYLVDVGVSGSSDQSTGAASNTAEDAGAPQILGSGPPRTVVEPSAERVLATGTDYTPASLPDTVSNLAEQAAPAAATGRPSPQVGGSHPAGENPASGGGSPSPDRATASSPCCAPLRAAAPLKRLTERSVLAACLDAIATAHAQGPVAVDLVDYATFQGRAALVVVFTDGSGARWAWVTGPDCGSPAAGADLTYQSRVG